MTFLRSTLDRSVPALLIAAGVMLVLSGLFALDAAPADVAGLPSSASHAAVASVDSGSPLRSQRPTGPLSTDVAPALSLDGLGGDEGRVELERLRGKPVWVNFMASYCPPCREELPLMERLQERYEDDVAIVLVDVQEPEEVVDEFVASVGVTLPVGLDRDGQAAEDWRAVALPIHFWLDAEGRIRGVVYGGAPPDVLVEGLRTVVPTATLEP